MEAIFAIISLALIGIAIAAVGYYKRETEIAESELRFYRSEYKSILSELTYYKRKCQRSTSALNRPASPTPLVTGAQMDEVAKQQERQTSNSSGL